MSVKAEIDERLAPVPGCASAEPAGARRPARGTAPAARQRHGRSRTTLPGEPSWLTRWARSILATDSSPPTASRKSIAA